MSPAVTRLVARFKDVYNRMDARNIELLDALYSQDVVFVDPFKELHGLPALRAYFTRLYQGVVSCRFSFEDEILSDDRAVLMWTMHLQHARLGRGETVQVSGASALRVAERISFHRDYFDAGALIYERLPLLGVLVRRVKAAL